MNYTKFLFFISCNLIVFSSFGQTTVRDSIIPNQVIEINQIYKPEIAKPEKPEIMPSLPKVDTTKPKFAYVVPQQTLSYTYHSVPIRPLALGKQENTIPFQNYIKAGFGNLTSLYFDAGYGGFTGENFETAFHLSHLSQSRDVQRQRISKTQFDATGKYNISNHAIGASLDLFHRGYNYYGYDQETYFYGKNAIRQGFTGGSLILNAENTSTNQWNINYKPEIKIGMYGDQYNAREQQIGFLLPVSYILDSTYQFSLGLKGNVASLTRNSVSVTNNYFQIRPSIQGHFKNLQVNLGVNPTLAQGNNWYILPDISLRTELFNKKFAFSAGWQGDLIQNTYQELSTKNPFMLNNYLVQQSRSNIIFAGFESKLGQHLAFGVSANWKQWNNLAEFINDNNNPDRKQFDVVYDAKVQSVGLDAYFHYQISQVVGLKLESSWNNFYQTTTFSKVWHEPGVKFKASLMTQPIKNLNLSATFDFWDRMFAMQANGSSEKLPAFFDLGIQGEYSIISRFSVFLQFNNIFNDKYQRWQQYDNFGFNIIGGLRFKF